MSELENTTISFRLPVPLRNELSDLANRSLLSVSDLCRQSVLDKIREDRSASAMNEVPAKREWLARS